MSLKKQSSLIADAAGSCCWFFFWRKWRLEEDGKVWCGFVGGTRWGTPEEIRDKRSLPLVPPARFSGLLGERGTRRHSVAASTLDGISSHKFASVNHSSKNTESFLCLQICSSPYHMINEVFHFPLLCELHCRQLWHPIADWTFCPIRYVSYSCSIFSLSFQWIPAPILMQLFTYQASVSSTTTPKTL